MNWDALRDNLGLLIFAAVWLVSFVLRAARRKGPGPVPGPLARRRRLRRRAVLLGFVLMAVAVGLWEISARVGGDDEAVLRVLAGTLAVAAFLAILFAGLSRPGSAVQGEIDLSSPDERAVEIISGEPLEPS